MKHSLDHHQWDEKLVFAHLESAAGIHRRLPEVKVAGYFSLWPETMKDDWTQLYETVNGRSRLGSPMPHEVTYHEEVMAWLRWIPRNEQQIIWMRANRLPWKSLEYEFGMERTKLWRTMNFGLIRIASILNSKAHNQ